jgi:hypothetical protein
MYRNYERKREPDNHIIRKYLVRRNDLSSNKPILWIYIPSLPNSRHIKQFGDGHSNSINQDYLFLTMKSIIKYNDQSFTICIIDNKSFNKILPGWEYDLNAMAPPISSNLIQLALAKVLYNYGGILVPVSFLCFKDLIGMYDYGTKGNKMFICENINKSITYSSHEFTTDTSFMGCKQHNKTMLAFIKFCEVIISTPQNTEFSGVFNEWFYKKNVVVINGKRIGTKTKTYKKISIEDLFSETYIPLSKEAYGIYIPSDDIIKRSNYEWFSRLSKKEVLSGNTNIQKYILLTSAHEPSNWISFWKVPSGIGSWVMPSGFEGKY